MSFLTRFKKPYNLLAVIKGIEAHITINFVAYKMETLN